MAQLLTGEKILEKSPAFPVIIQESETGMSVGHYFDTEKNALTYLANKYPIPDAAKIHVPLAMLMLGVYNLSDPKSPDRPAKDFRIVTPDRVVAPDQDDRCVVLPYFVHTGMTSIDIKTGEEDKDSPFMAAIAGCPFTLNILDPDIQWPDRQSVFPAAMVAIRPNGIPAEELIARYAALKQVAGTILARAFNAPVATFA